MLLGAVGGGGARGRWLSALVAIVLCLLCDGRAHAVTGGDPVVTFERYRLENGLEVILSQNRRLPRVAVNLRYKVGSASDAPGKAGAAHVYEHLYAFCRPRLAAVTPEAVGATQVGATTEFDRTTYYTTLPSAHAEVALAVESERMRDIGTLIDEPLLVRELQAVRNERRMVVENKPYGLPDEAVIQSLFPAGHPYHHIYIGAHRDIQSVTLEDARNFFASYYVPGNAILSIAGDFEIAAMKLLVKKHFAAIPAGKPGAGRAKAPLPRIVSEQRQTVPDAIDRPRVSIAWKGPANYAAGGAETDMLAVILGQGSLSRLHRALVGGPGIAQSVSAQNLSFELGSAFIVNVTAGAGATVEQIERAVDAEIGRLRESGPSDEEIVRARNTMELRIVRGLEQLGNITAIADVTLESPYGGVAEQLSECSYFTGDPGCLGKRIGQYRQATARSVRDAARGLFGGPGRVVVHAVPGTKTVDDPPVQADARQSPPPDRKASATPPVADQVKAETLPVPVVRTLPNGMTIYIVKDPSAPVVTAALLVKGGTASAPADRPGLAAFVADMLVQGTARRPAARLEHDVAQLGTSIDIDSNWDAVALRIRMLHAQLPAALDILSDIARFPAFPEAAIERVRDLRQRRMAELDASPDGAASHMFTAALYGAQHPFSGGGLFNDVLFARRHPYGYKDLGTADSLRSIGRDDLARFHAASFVPANAALIVVGNITEAEIDGLARRYFGAWAGNAPAMAQVVAVAPAAGGVLVKDIGPASQTAIRIGGLGVSRAAPDAMAIRTMNVIFGEVYASRLTGNLRVKNGYTYMVRSRFALGREPGPFVVGTSVRSDATQAAIKEIFSEMRRMGNEPASDGEINVARRYIENALFEQFETSSSTAMSIGDIFVYDLPIDTFRAQLKAVQRIGADEIQAVARRYLVPEKMIVVTVGDARQIGQP